MAFLWSSQPWLVWPGWVLFVVGMVGMLVSGSRGLSRLRAESEQMDERLREIREKYERMSDQRDGR
ncbi:hypothetical protein [Nocardia xishanensis]|uniref:hypothetical protein n=1 Tax=Nocardia xishanensis TaxID=238964 RepID=UPI00340B0BA5